MPLKPEQTYLLPPALKLTARIESTNPRHARIGVFQNGGKAGVLCVDVEYAEQIVGLLNQEIPKQELPNAVKP